MAMGAGVILTLAILRLLASLVSSPAPNDESSYMDPVPPCIGLS